MSAPDITPDLLLRAYAAGVFPMSEGADDPEIFWVEPNERGIFPLDSFHVSRSLARRIMQADYTVTINNRFDDVVTACADREATWINAEIKHLYLELHKNGHAHSVEICINGSLIGGVYGVTLGGAFFGESMFSRARDGSKIALVYLVARLIDGGFKLFDTQFITPHLASMGAIEIPKNAYISRLNKALLVSADFNKSPAVAHSSDVLQLITQTS